MRRKTKNGQKTGGALKRTPISQVYIYIYIYIYIII